LSYREGQVVISNFGGNISSDGSVKFAEGSVLENSSPQVDFSVVLVVSSLCDFDKSQVLVNIGHSFSLFSEGIAFPVVVDNHDFLVFAVFVSNFVHGGLNQDVKKLKELTQLAEGLALRIKDFWMKDSGIP
jgi:hypothetical protein